MLSCLFQQAYSHQHIESQSNSSTSNMKYLAITSALVATVAAQGVTELIAPKTPTPKGCKTSFDGTFEVTVVDIKKRDLQPEVSPCLVSRVAP